MGRRTGQMALSVRSAVASSTPGSENTDAGWTKLPGVGVLVGAPDRIVAYRGSDGQGSASDYRFFASEDRWIALPDDPLPPVYDHFVVEYEGRFLLFGSPIGRAHKDTKLAAVYDPGTDTREIGWRSNLAPATTTSTARSWPRAPTRECLYSVAKS